VGKRDSGCVGGCMRFFLPGDMIPLMYIVDLCTVQANGELKDVYMQHQCKACIAHFSSYH